MKEAGIFQQYTDKYDKEMYVQAVKKQLYQKVYDEVRSEVKNDALTQAEEEIERRTGLRKIEEYKKAITSLENQIADSKQNIIDELMTNDLK